MSDVGGSALSTVRSHAHAAIALGSIWLVFLIFPGLALAHAHRSTLHEALAFAGVAAFVVTYCGLLVASQRLARPGAALALSAWLMALAVALTALDRDGWASLFIYAAAAGALVLEERAAVVYVLAAAALAGTLSAIAGGSSAVLSYTVTSAGVGFMLIMVGQLRARNLALQRARNELAELAVARERERFARDLHDLLGHSLSVIALKAQLVRRLIAASPEDAEVHLGELEEVARAALTEVRDAVSGYREPSLDDALTAARVALEAASIDAHFDVAPAELTPRAEGVLAWAVREGTTNVIRHSGSRNCWIRLGGGETTAALEILDDGRAGGEASPGGSGLRGLRERATAVAGRVESGTRGDGGFRLAVTLPRSAP